MPATSRISRQNNCWRRISFLVIFAVLFVSHPSNCNALHVDELEKTNATSDTQKGKDDGILRINDIKNKLGMSDQTKQNPDPIGRMSIANMTCGFFQQPLNHFLPRGRSPTYAERYCVYDGYVSIPGGGSQRQDDGGDYNHTNNSPIFFYTGNESPLEQYINQTGLMWELAPKFGARIVFVEHRYEGESLPNISTDCLSYGSTIQALEDYARILEEELNPENVAPVIVFGGSYGGMLSAWMRMKYPHLVVGAIAASAPIGAFPQNADLKIDYSARVLANGLDRPYPPTFKREIPENKKEVTKQRTDLLLQGTLRNVVGSHSSKETETEERKLLTEGGKNYCRDNLLAAWPLISWLAKQDDKRISEKLLQTSFSMCEPLSSNDASPLLHWAQRVWFDLAEGSFPYPSSYIPFALLHKKVNLPPWPTQDACWKSSELHRDWGVRFHGSREDVRYRIDYGNSGISLEVDWDTVTVASNEEDSESAGIGESTDIIGLLTSVRDAVSIWYNITKDVPCYNISQAAPNSMRMSRRRSRKGFSPLTESLSADISNYFYDASPRPGLLDSALDPAKLCHEAMVEQGSWGLLCCNDEMNLVITDAQGMGHDFFWPPSHPKSIRTYKDMIRGTTFEPCADPYGIYGYSREPIDPLSIRLDTYYGGVKMNGHSNIVFSNGLLDPWSAGGVYKHDGDSKNFFFSDEVFQDDKAHVQHINDEDVIALIIPFGGHHTDLMYSSDSDPGCVTEGRKIEEEYIARWIRD